MAKRIEPIAASPAVVWGSNLFHVGILLIFAGHFVGLLTPIWIFDALGVSHTFKQWTAILVGGVAGTMCFVGITLLVHRRLFDARIRKTSSFGDIAVLLMLYAQLILGLSTIAVSPHIFVDGHEGWVKFMTWAQGILALQPGVSALVADVESESQAASAPRNDDLSRLPVHAPRARLERARFGTSDAVAIKWCAQPGMLPRPPSRPPGGQAQFPRSDGNEGALQRIKPFYRRATASRSTGWRSHAI